MRVVDQMKRQCWVTAVTDCVEPLKPADRTVENAFAALMFDIVPQIARHRRDHFDAFARQKFGKILLARLLQDCEVAAIHHFDAEFACLAHQPPEMRIEFGRSAGDVERRYLLTAKKVQDQVGDRTGHFFGSVGPGIDVTMDAGLVAAIADVDLQRFQLAAPDRRKSNLVEQRQRVAHR